MTTTLNQTAALETLLYHRDQGWRQPLPAGLDSARTLVAAFASPRFADDRAPIEALRKAFPTSCLIGCSTAGEIIDDEVHDDSIALAVYRFSDTTLRFACTPVNGPADSERAGRCLGEQLAAKNLRAAFVLSSGLGVNGSELVRGLNQCLPPHVIVTGGLAGDGARFERTWILRDGEPVDGHVTTVGFYGDAVRVGHGSRGGWDVFGPVRLVTASEGNVLYELDGKPALALYKEYLGARANELPSSALLFPLALRPEGDKGKSLVRTILSVDEARQSMTFAGDVPIGSTAQLMRANFDRLVTAAGESSACAARDLAGARSSPALSIAISCIGRRLILGERTEEELEAAKDALGPSDRQIGFYSYGELSPFSSGKCDLHNQTMTITSICEA